MLFRRICVVTSFCPTAEKCLLCSTHIDNINVLAFFLFCHVVYVGRNISGVIFFIFLYYRIDKWDTDTIDEFLTEKLM